MLDVFWSGVSGKIADRWAALLTSPTLAFWIGGTAAWVWAHGGFTGTGSGWVALDECWHRDFLHPTASTQIALILLGLLLVAGTGRLVESLGPPTTRVMAGYLPGWAARGQEFLVRMRGRRIERVADRWRELARRRGLLSAAERAEYARLDARRARVPAAVDDRMATGLGDLLRAAESRPGHRYGLQAAVCWPRLWLVLPEQARGDVGAARSRMDQAAQAWLVSLAFSVWTVFAWWAAPVAVIGMIAAYRAALTAAGEYAVLVQSCFDIHRRSLYEALGAKLPSSAREELIAGRQLTAVLARGPSSAPERNRKGA